MTATFPRVEPSDASPPTIDGDIRDAATWQIRPAPAREPWFDDEQPARHLTLVSPDAPALPFAPPPGVVRQPRRRSFYPVPDPGPAAHPASTSDGSPAASEVERFGRQLFTGLLEVLAGHRPAVQLAPLTSSRIHARITQDAANSDRLGCAGKRPALRSMRVSHPCEGVAELSAVIAVGNRCRAVAARVENSHGRWRCVRLQIG